jgi:hypothetical protein
MENLVRRTFREMHPMKRITRMKKVANLIRNIAMHQIKVNTKERSSTISQVSSKKGRFSQRITRRVMMIRRNYRSINNHLQTDSKVFKRN